MEIAALVIAAYAAIVSTVLGILAWRARRSQLLLKLMPGKAELGFSDESAGHQSEVIYMEIVNRSEHPVKVMSLAFEAPDNRRFVVIRPFPVDEPLPIVIPARDKKLLWANREDRRWEPVMFDQLRFHVYTADNREFSSKWHDLDDEPRFEIVTPARSGRTLR